MWWQTVSWWQCTNSWQCHSAFLRSGWFVHAEREYCLKSSLFSSTVLPVNGVQTHCYPRTPNVQTVKVRKMVRQSQFCLEPILTQMRMWSSTPSSPPRHPTHVHRLQGPKCKLTQLTEAFAPIKHSRAFNNSHKFAPWIKAHYTPSFTSFICAHPNPFKIIDLGIYSLKYTAFFFCFVFFKQRCNLKCKGRIPIPDFGW